MGFFITSAFIFEEKYVKFIASIFIILFLYLLALERIVLQFKSSQAQEEKDEIEKRYYKSEITNKILIEKNKKLIKQNDNFRKILPELLDSMPSKLKSKK